MDRDERFLAKTFANSLVMAARLAEVEVHLDISFDNRIRRNWGAKRLKQCKPHHPPPPPPGPAYQPDWPCPPCP